jgi:hypothetical protein
MVGPTSALPFVSMKETPSGERKLCFWGMARPSPFGWKTAAGPLDSLPEGFAMTARLREYWNWQRERTSGIHTRLAQRAAFW